MFSMLTERLVYAMAGVRMLSSLIELSGALLMLYFGTVSRALQINGVLALVGPTVLITVTVLGIAGLADGGHVSPTKVVWIVVGVGCILYGART